MERRKKICTSIYRAAIFTRHDLVCMSFVKTYDYQWPSYFVNIGGYSYVMYKFPTLVVLQYKHNVSCRDGTLMTDILILSCYNSYICICIFLVPQPKIVLTQQIVHLTIRLVLECSIPVTF